MDGGMKALNEST